MTMNRLGSTRTVVRTSHALVAPDGHVASVLPGWSRCRAVVLVAPAMGARFSQYLVTLEAGGEGEGRTGPDSWFFFVVSGEVVVGETTLVTGGFAYAAPDTTYRVSAEGSAVVLVFRKPYEPLAGHEPPGSFTGREQDVAEAPFLGDPHARLKILIPDTPAADMAINVFTYDPGATLPFVETHVMEHGMLFLDGGGIYRLDEEWHPVTAGDAIWIAPYCPQWFIAAGPGPARYIYYKDVNRLPG